MRSDSMGDEQGASVVADAARQPIDGPNDCDDVGGGHWSMGVRSNLVPRQVPRSLPPVPPLQSLVVKRGQHDAYPPDAWQYEQSGESLNAPLFWQGQQGSSS